MRILITGSNGFLGKNLVKHIQEEYPSWKIFGFDIVETGQENYNFNKVNFNEKEDWKPCFKEIEPEYIFYLIGLFRGDNKILYRTNAYSFQNFIEDLRISEIEAKLLIIGSASQYGRIKAEDNPVNEEYKVNLTSIYGLSKQHQEKIALFYNQNYGLDVVCTRLSSYIGKGVARSLLAGYLIHKFSSEKKIIDLEISNPNDVRDYIDVRDVANALVKLQTSSNSTGEIIKKLEKRVFELEEKHAKDEKKAQE